MASAGSLAEERRVGRAEADAALWGGGMVFLSSTIRCSLDGGMVFLGGTVRFRLLLGTVSRLGLFLFTVARTLGGVSAVLGSDGDDKSEESGDLHAESGDHWFCFWQTDGGGNPVSKQN